ncbi:glycosyltransferase family 2 protein [Citrobacter sedlakii]|uniref:glycosyltransferase family 2 protein n=1 Tax=Citrobacter sedlakii TaxID=67826 RepID=UPI00333CD5A7
MKVSIITVTYNSEKTLRDTLESVEIQSYKDIEYIIVDGGSTDNTMQVVNDFSTRVSKCISEKDKGIYDALNKGILLASGEIIGFIHSDDILAQPNIIELIVKEFQSKQADIVYGDLVFVDKERLNIVKRYWKSGPFKRYKIALGWIPPHPSFYLKRDLYLKDGFFDLSFRIAADYDQMIRILRQDNIKVSYLPQVFVKMRLGGESTKFDNAARSTREIIGVMKKQKIYWPIAIIWRKISKFAQLFSRA